MDIFLQIWGGSFYLINKIFFAFAEGKKNKTKRWMKINGWIIYILGVPAWVIILIMQHDWIAASIEAGGIPAMLFGLYNSFYYSKIINKKFDYISKTLTYLALLLGIGFSLYDFGGITSISQLLEIGVMVGFLMGSYYLAKSMPIGWVFFMLMNGSMGTLMLLQNKPILTVQQIISLSFVIYGYLKAVKINSN